MQGHSYPPRLVRTNLHVLELPDRVSRVDVLTRQALGHLSRRAGEVVRVAACAGEKGKRGRTNSRQLNPAA